MLKQAKYFRNKFIRNGIAGFIFLIFFLGGFLSDDQFKEIPWAIIIVIIVPCLWLYLGLRLRKKIKSKLQRMTESDTEALAPSNSRKLDILLRFLFVVLMVVYFRETSKFHEYAGWVFVPLVIAYSAWIYFQVQKVNKFLDS